MMPSYHPDFIVSCQRRQNHLRHLLLALKEAEAEARRWPKLRSAQRTVDFQADALADFMHKNCGFPLQEPRWKMPSAIQAQRDYIDWLLSLPLPAVPARGLP